MGFWDCFGTLNDPRVIPLIRDSCISSLMTDWAGWDGKDIVSGVITCRTYIPSKAESDKIDIDIQEQLLPQFHAVTVTSELNPSRTHRLNTTGQNETKHLVFS